MNIQYIWHDKNITNEYPNKFAHGKINKYFANEYIRPKYSNVFEYQIVFPRLFYTILAFSYFVLFWTHIEPFWTVNNNF